MKVNELQYGRVDVEKAAARVGELTSAAICARGGRELADIRAQLLDLGKEILSAATISEIRFSQNTADKFYVAEKNYYDESLPSYNAECVKFERAFLASPFLPLALEFMPPAVAKVYELSVKAMDERIIGESVREAKLITEYSALMSGMTFPFGGKNIPLSVLNKYLNDADRKVRRKAAETLGKTLSLSAKRLDGLFSHLVAVRAEKAKKMGISDFAVMGDMQMNRYSYGRGEITAFRSRIRDKYVPLVSAHKHEIAVRLGLDRFMAYDNEVYFVGGNPEPRGGAEEIFAAARKMYAKLGEETGKFFAFMEDEGAFDVFPRKNKWGGGFCTSIDKYKQPFILANFNGSSGDIDVLTHEVGHALAFYKNLRGKTDYELAQSMTMSIAEVHSMAMEFFAYPHAELFFDRADDYRKMHMASALTFLPYGCMVDEFEETCYRNVGLAPSERNALWLSLEKKYRPHLNYGGIPYLENGTRWQYQSHIFETPMYYIDYCIAQIIALEFYELSKQNYSGAFAKYLEFMSHGGDLPLVKLCKTVGITSPFSLL